MNIEDHTIPADELPPSAKPRRRWVAPLLGILIFLAGFVVGVGLTTALAVHRLQDVIHHPEKTPSRLADTLQRRLQLNDDQRAKVEAIVAGRQRELMEIRANFQPQINEQLDAVRDEIGEVLSDLQRKRWIEMFEEFRERWVPAVPQAAITKPSGDAAAEADFIRP